MEEIQSTETTDIKPLAPAEVVIVGKKTKIFSRPVDCTCEQCAKEFKGVSSRARFCSDKCRGAFFRKNHKPVKTEQPTSKALTTDKGESKEKESRIPQTVFNGIQPSMAIAVSMLQKEADRWENLYNEERKKANEMEAQLLKLKEEKQASEFKARLDGIQAQKPDFLDRVMSGLGNIPQPIVEQIAPIIGRIAGAMLPSAITGEPSQIAGPELNELDKGLLQWLSTLDGSTKDLFYKMCGQMMNTEPHKIATILNNSINSLKQPKLNGHPSTQLGVDMSMYGAQ